MVDPTAGFVLTLNQEFAGLGGDTQYTKTQGNAKLYRSLFEEAVVLSAELEGGYIFTPTTAPGSPTGSPPAATASAASPATASARATSATPASACAARTT